MEVAVKLPCLMITVLAGLSNYDDVNNNLVPTY